MRSFSLHLFVLLTAATVSAALVGRALGGFFILDDFAWLDCARDAATDPSHLFTLHISNFFRPVAHAVWAVVTALFGLSPVAHHLALLLVHAVATTLLAHLVWRVFDDHNLALACAICFLINPAYSEAVIWISGISEPVAAVTVIITLLAFRRWLTGEGRPGLALGLTLGGFVLAHGAKESAVSLLPLMALLHVALALRGPILPGRRWIYLPLALVELGYLAAQYQLQQQSYLVIEDHYAIGPHALWSIGGSLWHLLSFTWPALAAAGLGALVRRRRPGLPSRRDLARLALLLAAVVIPAVPYAMFRGNLLASRYFYLPAMGLALACALALRPLFRSGRTALQLLGLLALVGLALQAAQTTRGAVLRYLRAAEQTERFVAAAVRLPARQDPVLILDGVLRGQHLSAAMRRFHPAGNRVRFREVTRRQLRLRPRGEVWRYTGRDFVRVDLR